LDRAKRLGGKAVFEIDLKGQALSPRSLMTVISGKGEVRLANATVPGITASSVTGVARKVIDGEIELEALSGEITDLANAGSVQLGSPKLKISVANGTISFPSLVFELPEGGLRNATFVDLPQWRIDSQWTVTPAPQPRPDNPSESVPLPPITLVFNGPVAEIAAIVPKIGLGDLERELIVRKMEANVAKLERLRREDEERAAAERERQRLIEEERRRSIEEEQVRRLQLQQGASGVTGQGNNTPGQNNSGQNNSGQNNSGQNNPGQNNPGQNGEAPLQTPALIQPPRPRPAAPPQ
jgi:hypothetical protein